MTLRARGRKRNPSVVSFRVGAWTRVAERFGASDLAGSRAAQAMDAGAPVLAADIARLKKKLLRRLLGDALIDHRSGAYRSAKAAIAQAFAAERRR